MGVGGHDSDAREIEDFNKEQLLKHRESWSCSHIIAN